MRILVCGSRNLTDKQHVLTVLKDFPPQSEIIQGGNGYLPSGAMCRTTEELFCAVRGADALAFQVAYYLGFTTSTFWADWDHLGPAAGPKRNQRMLEAGKPELVIGFPRGTSYGTKDMMLKAESAGIVVLEY